MARSRLREYRLKLTPDEVLSLNRGGDVLNRYVRHVTPLELWHRDTLRKLAKSLKYHKPMRHQMRILAAGIDEHLMQVGQRYGALWREAVEDRSPPHLDPTAVVVDGGRMQAGPPLGREVARKALGELQREVICDAEVAGVLNRLCGADDWPEGDKRRFKRLAKRGLRALALYWRK